MANAVYNSFKRDIANGSIDLDTDTINVMLVTSSYSPTIDTHTKRSDITNEVTGTGYTAGGQALASKTVTADNTNDRAAFDAADVTWTTATITARGAVYTNPVVELPLPMNLSPTMTSGPTSPRPPRTL